MTIALRSIALIDNAVVSKSVMPSFNLTIPVPANNESVPQTDRKADRPSIHKDFSPKREAGSDFSNLLECLCDDTGKSSIQKSTEPAIDESGESIQQLDDAQHNPEANVPVFVPQVVAAPPAPDPNFSLLSPTSFGVPGDTLSIDNEGLSAGGSEQALFSENGTGAGGRIPFPDSGTDGETRSQVKVPEHPGLQLNNAEEFVEPKPQSTLPTTSQPVSIDLKIPGTHPEATVVSPVSATQEETGADTDEDSSHAGESPKRRRHLEIVDAIKGDGDSEKSGNASFNRPDFENLELSTDQSAILPGLDSIDSAKGSSGSENAPVAFPRFAAFQPDARVGSPGTYDFREIDPVHVLRQVSDAPAVRAGIEKINVLDESTVRLELSPSKLGELTVEIKRSESVIKVHIVADRIETHAVLERNLESLIQAFRDRGGMQVDVDVSQHHSNHSRQGSRQEADTPGISRSQVTSTTVAGRSRPGTLSENSIDIYV